MKILIATPVHRDANGRPFVFPKALASHYALTVIGDVDYLTLSAIDRQQANKSITAKYQQARAVALDSGYDALLTLESDMIVPPDALERLLELSTDVAYALYVFRHGRYAWSASTALSVDKNEPLSNAPDTARKLWGQVIKVAGIGLGCTLIRRHVLEVVPFHCREHGHNDWTFAQDVAYAGGEQLCHTGVVCGHIHKNTVLYPDVNEENLCRVETL